MSTMNSEMVQENYKNICRYVWICLCLCVHVCMFGDRENVIEREG